MKKFTFLFILGFFVLSIGAGCVTNEDSNNSTNTEPTVAVPSDMDSFAKCLTEKGAKLYGAVWCPHCQNQKKAFGESVQYVTYVECAVEGSKEQATACKTAGIEGYPTWQFADGSEILGEATFEQLSEKTSCPL